MNWLQRLAIKKIAKKIKKKIKESKMKKLLALWNWLNGKKTYLAATALIIQAIIEYSASGDLGMLATKIIAAVGLMSTRAAITKSNGKVKK